MSKNVYQYELDIARIAGAISIVLYHYTFRGYAADNMSPLHFPILGSVFIYGYLGIFIFFILSGYTIILSGKNKTVTAFIRSRILRLYPSFWVAVCLTTFVTFLMGGDRFNVDFIQFMANLTMLSKYLGIKSVDNAYWFMFVILKFYFIIATLILFGAVRFYKYVAGLWLLLSFVVVFFQVPKIGFFLIPDYAPFFISGMIFYSAKEEGWDLYKWCIILMSLLFSLFLVGQEIPNFNETFSADISYVIVFFLILSIFIFMLFVSINRKPIKLARVFRTLGACTYPLYLIHQNIGFMLFQSFGTMLNKYVVLVCIFSLMLLVAFLIVKYIDPYIHNILNSLIPINDHLTK